MAAAAIPTAVKALRVALPEITTRVAKWSPDLIRRAKDFYGQAVGVPPAKVNLGEEAKRNQGRNAQVVVESLVRAGVPIEDLFSGLDPRIDFSAIRDDLRAIAAQRVAASDSHSNSYIAPDEASASQVAATVANNREFSRAMLTLGVPNIRELYRVKMALEMLTTDRVTKYLEIRQDGTPDPADRFRRM